VTSLWIRQCECEGKLYSTLVLNLLLYGCENWVLTAPLRQRLNTFHNRCVRAMARPQRTSFSSTNDHPAPFGKRPALAPMYSALGLTSLDLVIFNRKLRWAGHVRRMDWSRLPRKFLASWVDAPRCRGRAHSYGHDLTREQLIGFNTDRAAVQRGVSLSWGAAAKDREMAQARSSVLDSSCLHWSQKVYWGVYTKSIEPVRSRHARSA
jgi:hypothetical protein